MSKHLTAYERETVIVFNDGDDLATITTHQRPILTKLDRNAAAVKTDDLQFGSTPGARFEIPKALISLRSKRRKRDLTPEQRQELGERLRKNRLGAPRGARSRRAALSVELATCRYVDFVPAMGIPVQTSLGKPKFQLAYPLSEEVGALKPYGIFGANLTDEEFARKYRERLDKVGISKLQRVFHAISRKHEGARLVMLCYEDLSKAGCHRRVFADWWLSGRARLCLS